MAAEINPREHDEAIAQFWIDRQKAELRVVSTKNTLRRLADQETHYFGRTAASQGWVVGRNSYVRASFEDALAVLAERGDEYRNISRSRMNAGELLAELAEREAVVEGINREIRTMEQLYTGWSRFFLVVSSAGHLHRSTSCHTCRPTTRYGWTPELSGKSDGEAVAELGPILCSVCYPDAPVEQQGGKLTPAKAAALAYKGAKR